MIKILTVIGARPQFVKAGALSRVFASNDQIEEVIVHTGQHFDENMSAVFFDEMEIPQAKYNLEVNGVGHGAMTGRMLEGIEQILLDENPDLLLVYGDTNSTLAGALAAKKLHIKVAHVEAGLRSFNMKMPEEVNRILTDRISDYLFCPTDIALENLKLEGYENMTCDIVKSGDVMQDAVNFYAEKAHQKSIIINNLGLDRFSLVTLHRAENTNDPNCLKAIVDALNEIHLTKIPVVLPLHPRTKAKLIEFGFDLKVNVIDPVGYFEMMALMKHASLVITDSGGLQKEAFFFKKNCITMRDQTEWVELIKADVNVLVGADKAKIISAVDRMMNHQADFSQNLYGNGMACQNIVNHIIQNH